MDRDTWNAQLVKLAAGIVILLAVLLIVIGGLIATILDLAQKCAR